ncbi:Protein of unknown function [Thermanaeromonas toyohensis ToBE]|uniref:DUF1232 domain-containing protein n=1 Tax=Thermanaeromonas toyohensis ToBE TaxID=698762 RepID=A0A1W1VEK8_9FIRM|nr:YkvA family protein [Thermanaeromonas toyohensis]SMB91756.1 Protein of unknown function [Thermanaeromonas toyohensis ToBE]
MRVREFWTIWKEQARKLKGEIYALYLAYRDPRVPWYAKLFTACLVGYAFSPLDLIPDFIPVLGHLDDLIIIPLGVALALRMIPQLVMLECREKARLALQDKPVNWIAAGIIVVFWLLLAAIVIAFCS